MKALSGLTAVAAATLIGGAVFAVPALSAPATAPACAGAGSQSSPADLDGDGTSDLAVGARKATEAGRYNAGAVDVHFDPKHGTRTQRFSEALFGVTPERGDSFGSALAFASVNGDQCADLAVGAPLADGGRGTVTIALGSSAGVSAAGAIRLSGRSVGEGFGSAVVADGADIFVSAPDRTVDGAKGAGAVDHYRVTDGTATLVQTLTEDTRGVHGGAEAGDGFGRDLSVAGDGGGLLVVGEPGEDVGTHAVDAGTATVIAYSRGTGRLTRSMTYSQNSPYFPGAAETGDHFGTSVSIGIADFRTVVVGVPGEALGTLRGAGTEVSFLVDDGDLAAVDVAALSRNSPGVPGTAEADDRFGKQVVTVGSGVCIAVPGADVGVFTDTGEVECQSDAGTWSTLRMGDEPIGGSPQRGAAYGTYLSTLPDTQVEAGPDDTAPTGGEDVLIAVPRARVSNDITAGQVRIASQLSLHDSAGAMPNEQYGVPAFVPSVGPQGDVD